MYKSLFSLLCVLTLGLGFGFSQTQSNEFTEEKLLFTKMPDLELMTTQGPQKLSDFYNKTPLIVAPIYTRCTGVCNPLVMALSEQIKKLNPKSAYRFVIISFDPRDNVADMQKMAAKMSLNKDVHWAFVTTKNIAKMNAAIGLDPKYDQKSGQFDHQPLVVGVNQNGYIVKRLVGLRSISDLKDMVEEVSGEFIASYPLPHKNQLFSCFAYDPKTGKRTLSVGMLLFVVPSIIGMMILVWFARVSKKNRKAKELDNQTTSGEV